MAYVHSLEGPWTEYSENLVMKGPSALDIRWIEESGQYFMWGHSIPTSKYAGGKLWSKRPARPSNEIPIADHHR